MSRVAVCTLGDLYCHLQRAMDQEVEATARALLHKAAESNAFIRQDVDTALGHMAQHCTPARCINAFLVAGIRSGSCRHTCTHTHTHARTHSRHARSCIPYLSSFVWGFFHLHCTVLQNTSCIFITFVKYKDSEAVAKAVSDVLCACVAKAHFQRLVWALMVETFIKGTGYI